jgi:hypothetical protein
MLTLRAKLCLMIMLNMRQINEGKLGLESADTVPVNKNLFLKRYKQTILDWTKDNESRLIESRRKYSWKNKQTQVCLAERKEITESINFSRSQNSGGIDLHTLDSIMSWGGFSQFPLRDEEKVLEITRKVFNLVDQGRISGAVEKLLAIDGVEIAQASRIIGLFDPNRFCIYDNRVGNALKTLQFAEKPVLKCPSGPKKTGDICSDERWGENYHRLIWTLEIIRDYLNREGYPFSIADIEMALFMMGK